jgi:acyl-CoA thioester hydrolase
MACEYVSQRRVEFSETDMAGLVHFTNFFKYVETAERDLFEACGLSLIDKQGGTFSGWPRTRLNCKFSAPLRFGDTIRIHLMVKELKDRAIEYHFRIYRLEDNEQQTLAAKGQLTTLYTRFDSETGELRSAELPQTVRDALQPCPETNSPHYS